MKLVLTYIWTGVSFLWLGALNLQYYYPESCPFAIASGISALVIWITAGQLRTLRRDR